MGRDEIDIQYNRESTTLANPNREASTAAQPKRLANFDNLYTEPFTTAHSNTPEEITLANPLVEKYTIRNYRLTGGSPVGKPVADDSDTSDEENVKRQNARKADMFLQRRELDKVGVSNDDGTCIELETLRKVEEPLARDLPKIGSPQAGKNDFWAKPTHPEELTEITI